MRMGWVVGVVLVGCLGGLWSCGAAGVDGEPVGRRSLALGEPCQTDANCFGATCCGGFCRDTSSDASNCGTCGVTCATGAACVAGACQCPSLQTACGGKCADVTSDPSNCGACGVQCPSTQTCIAPGNCGCVGTSTLCGTTCIDPNSDSNNCGDCGVKCSAGQVCMKGSCQKQSLLVTDGLLGWWTFDEGAGTVANDSSGNNLNGTLRSSPGWITDGKIGNALDFNAGGDVLVRFPNDARGDGAPGSPYIPLGDMTFAMWFRTVGPNPGGLQVVEGATWGWGCDRPIGNGGPSALYYNMWSEVNYGGTINVTDGRWHHVTFVLDRTTGMRSYIDGNWDNGTMTPTSNCGVGCSGFDWASDYVIGTSLGCRFGAGGFNGQIDDVRMYKRPLSAVEAQTLTHCPGGVCQSCRWIKNYLPGAGDGVYTIDPDGPGGNAPFDAYCDMTTDGGGWTLVGKGREGWSWLDAGEGTLSDLATNPTTNTVAYVASATVQQMMSNVTFDRWVSGLRVHRDSGFDQNYYMKASNPTGFAWSLYRDSRHGCVGATPAVVPGTARGTASANLGLPAFEVMGVDLRDFWPSGGNDCTREFTPNWVGHGCVGGWSTGATCNPNSIPQITNCWMAGNEGHCIPHVTVWVKD